MQHIDIILFALFVIAIFCCAFAMFKYIKLTKDYMNSEPINTIYFIKTLDNDIIINCDSIKTIKQGYNKGDKEYQILIQTDTETIIESFDNEINCKERFDNLYNIVNDITC